jgi:phosphoserine phosphatase
MASSLTLTVGPVSAEKNYADNAKVQATLEHFAIARNLWMEGDVTLTNQEKTDLLLQELHEHVVRVARNRDLDVRRAALVGDVATDTNLE